MAKDVPNKNALSHTLENLVIDLVDLNQIENQDLFLILDQEARKHNYMLSHGTFIRFTPVIAPRACYQLRVHRNGAWVELHSAPKLLLTLEEARWINASCVNDSRWELLS